MDKWTVTEEFAAGVSVGFVLKLGEHYLMVGVPDEEPALYTCLHPCKAQAVADALNGGEV